MFESSLAPLHAHLLFALTCAPSWEALLLTPGRCQHHTLLSSEHTCCVDSFSVCRGQTWPHDLVPFPETSRAEFGALTPFSLHHATRRENSLFSSYLFRTIHHCGISGKTGRSQKEGEEGMEAHRPGSGLGWSWMVGWGLLSFLLMQGAADLESHGRKLLYKGMSRCRETKTKGAVSLNIQPVGKSFLSRDLKQQQEESLTERGGWPGLEPLPPVPTRAASVLPQVEQARPGHSNSSTGHSRTQS